MKKNIQQFLEKYWRLIALAIVIILLFCRSPILFINPRFWAEEGSVYFSTAYHSTWYVALFSPHQGYFSLIPNVMTLISARLVPLENAPLVTTISSFLIHLIPYIIVFYRLNTVLNHFQQILLSLGVTFVAHTGEIWLTTIASQYHFGLIAFLLLMANHKNVISKWRIFDRALLLIAGLTGTVSCFLTPVYFFRWLYGKSRNLLILNIILGASSVIQLLCYIFGKSMVDRFISSGFIDFAMRWALNYLLRPMFGIQQYDSLASKFVLAGVAFLILLSIIYIVLHSKNSVSVFIVLSFFIVSSLSLVGSINMAGGWRYNYIPAVMIFALFCINVINAKNYISKALSGLLITISIIFWVPDYRNSLSPFVDYSYPDWKKEVRLWRENPDRDILIWPQWEIEKWKVKLDEKG